VTDAEPRSDADETPPDFESALAELETLVERMEGGDLPLDESLAAFERGVRLTRHCRAALARAEQRVKVLLEQADGRLVTEDTAAPGDDGTDAS
jgi:exodeoxyribonuclease VII small subunit